MYGDDVGTFNAYLDFVDGGDILFYNRNSSQGNKWIMNDIELTVNGIIDIRVKFD